MRSKDIPQGLMATLEVWARNNEGVPICREAVVKLLPSCSVEPFCTDSPAHPQRKPTIKITDLVPVESQSQFLAFNPSLETKLNMGTYKSALNMAKHDLAEIER